MEDKSKSSEKRNRSMRHLHGEDQHEFSTDDYQRLIPISVDHLVSAASISPKRRRCSITTDSIQTSSTEQNFIYDRPMPNMFNTRKRTAQDDMITYTHPTLFREQDHYSNKRARYEHSRSIELENQPPCSSINSVPLSFLTCHPELARRSSTWANLPIEHDVPPSFQQIPPLSRATTRPEAASATAMAYSQHDSFSDPYRSMLNEHLRYHRHSSSTFSSNSSRITEHKHSRDKHNMCSLSSQPNENCPLRTTNFLLDNKQQDGIVRNGNISPAHSDSSSESTSTCSSDEQSHQHFAAFRNPYLQHAIPQTQPWRTYRERENYEQLIDLAEKLSDPNRFKQVDVQQFFSYRYKTESISPEALSKQTACVICMSHFKNGQHIRVLPCQHEYHSKCIARWFTMNSSCPICRRDNFF